LWEWAVEAGVPASRALLDIAHRAPDDVPPLSVLLREGGVFHDISGGDKRHVLAQFVERLPLPPEQDRKVHALFMVVSPLVPTHLRILAQLGFVLRDEVLRAMLRDRASAADIIGRVEMIESTRSTGSFRAASANTGT
jgi:hypothetical protein